MKNLSNLTKIQLSQAINNRLRQGLDVSDYLEALKGFKETDKTAITVVTVIHSEEEKAAIMAFNSDKRFKITE